MNATTKAKLLTIKTLLAVSAGLGILMWSCQTQQNAETGDPLPSTSYASLPASRESAGDSSLSPIDGMVISDMAAAQSQIESGSPIRQEDSSAFSQTASSASSVPVSGKSEFIRMSFSRSSRQFWGQVKNFPSPGIYKVALFLIVDGKAYNLLEYVTGMKKEFLTIPSMEDYTFGISAKSFQGKFPEYVDAAQSYEVYLLAESYKGKTSDSYTEIKKNAIAVYKGSFDE